MSGLCPSTRRARTASLLASTSLMALALALAAPVACAADYVIPAGTVVAAPVKIGTTTPGTPFSSILNLGGIAYSETTKTSTFALDVNSAALSVGIRNSGTITVAQTLGKLSIHSGSTGYSATGETKAIVLYGTNLLTGSLENVGTIKASRVITAAPVIKTSSAVAISEYAEGLHVETYLAGGIVNASTGVIDISNDVTATLSLSDNISNMSPVTTIFATGVIAEATGVANSISNAGTLAARARAAITEQVVTASAASLLASATARAVGIEMTRTGAVIPLPATGATVVNSGIIDVVASATHTTDFAIATTLNVDPGRLIQSIAGAIAAGVNTGGAPIAHFENAGSITAAGTALTVSSGSVSTFSTAALLSYNDPKSPSTFPESGSVGGAVTAYGVSFAGGSLGDVTNSGSIDVSGLAVTAASASASARDDTRVTQQNFAAVALTGINISPESLTGPVVNTGSVVLSASAQLDSRQTAADDGAATRKKAKVEASGYLNTQLAGISVFAATGQAAGVSVAVRNTGIVSLASSARGSQAALALSEGAAEASLLYSAGANALSAALLSGTNLASGVSINAPNVLEVTNSGVIDIDTAYASALTATAGGGGQTAEAAAGSGASSFSSFGLNVTQAQALPTGPTVATTIGNSGVISVSAMVELANTATATASQADGVAGASALSQSTALSSLPGLDGAIAAGYGIYANLGGLDGSFANSGVIAVEQALAIDGIATATGASAQATAVSDGLSLAMGVLALPGAITGPILNSGTITVLASGRFDATAQATAGTGAADAGATGIVLAGGLVASTAGTAGFSSSADILSQASVATRVTGTASGGADGTANGTGSALALGVMLSGTAGLSGDLINGALIGATALSSVSASGSGGNASADATSVASAFGLLTAAGAGIGGDLVNTGTIGATAQADATATGGTAAASAFAYGLALDALGGVGGSIINAGIVLAVAGTETDGGGASGTAVAVGLQIASGTVAGTLTNSGVVSAQASGSDPNANAIALGAGVYGQALGAAQATALDPLGVDATLAPAGAVTVTDGLVNTGGITATADASGHATAILVAGGSSIGTLTNQGGIFAIEGDAAGIAIDLSGAGSATRIGLEDGAVFGDLVLSSHHADAITWSGGTFIGDVFGGGLGSLTVQAGADASFAYSGALESLASVAVGGDGMAVTLAFSGTASGIGQFSVMDQGLLALGAASVIETASYTQSAGAMLGVYLAPDWTAAPITATAAALDGTLAVQGVTGLRAKTTSYEIVASSDISGGFAAVTTPNSLLSAAVTYDADGATLVLTRNATTSLAGLSLAGRSLAAGIDLNYQRLSLSSPLSPVLDSFYLGTDRQAAHLINQMSGAPLADAAAAGMASFGAINGQISQQLAATRGTGALPGGGSALLSYGAGEVSLAGNAYAAAGSTAPGPWASLAPDAAPAPENGVWLRPFGHWGSLDTGNGTVSSSGGGVLGGVERAFGENARGGVVFSYQTADLSFTGPASGSLDQWTAAFYAERQWGAAYANLFATYGYQTTDISRSITYGGQLFTARSDHSANAGAVVSEAGYAYTCAPGAKLEPYLRLAYAALNTEAFAERGSGVFNLNVAADTTQSLQSTLGLRLAQPVELAAVPVTLRLEAGWQHEYLDTGARLGATFLSDGTIGFDILSGGPGDLALAAAGVSFALGANLEGYLEYRGSFGDGYASNTASAQLRLRF